MRMHVYPLDAVRFCAALSVVAFHLCFYAWASDASSVAAIFDHATAYPELVAWTWFGWVGVPVFFVLSGFVIANSANGAAPIAFAKSRVLRLYPAAWACAVLTLAAWLWIDGAAWQSLVRPLAHSATLWLRGPWIDAVYWTLAVEMVFYGIIFLLLLTGSFARLSWVAAALLLCSGVYLLTRYAFSAQLGALDWWSALRTNDDMLRFGCYFAVGIWMWLFGLRGLRAPEAVAFLAAVLVCCVELHLRTIELRSGEVTIDLAISSITPIAIWLGAVGLMMIFARAPQRFAPSSPRVQAALKHVGQMTYPLYLTHAVVGAGLIRLLLDAGVQRWLALAVVVATVLGASSAVAMLAEPRVRHVLRGLWDRGENALRRAPALAILFRPGGLVAAP